ncbi:hypothetical protein Pmani_037155 [Petrolisthes manimaculis]|uniref:Uncharacterized protein n=1 Tax=Petrolisthes manimaculis TaxID=1843537 RepID=A0AAE1NGV1_9EUCA|nr:hypothetical protein Pmani_037155 [Petrolisthes manimaculis]
MQIQRHDCHDSTPSLEDVVALPDPAGSSAWVYHPEEDKTPTALYPMGLDLLSDFPDGSRRLPARHASFVTTRYARVHQRPQRAQSFAACRDTQTAEGRLRPPPPVTLPEPPGSRSSHYARPNMQRVQRSNSLSGRLILTSNNSTSATLSRKFHACSLDDLDAAQVIEVGMSREMSRSEQSLGTTRQDAATDVGGVTVTAGIHRSASVQERLLDGKTVLTSFGPVNTHTVTRIPKPKCPAPPPPRKPNVNITPHPGSTALNNPEENSSRETVEKLHITDKLCDDGHLTLDIDESREFIRRQEEENPEPRVHSGSNRRVSSLERHIPLPVIEENIKNTRKRPAPQPRTIIRSQVDQDTTKDSPINKPSDTSVNRPSESAITPSHPSISRSQDISTQVQTSDVSTTPQLQGISKPARPPDVFKPSKPARPPDVSKTTRPSEVSKPPRLVDISKPARPEITKPPRPSVAEKALRLADKNMTISRPQPVQKPARKTTNQTNSVNLQKLEEVLTNILDHGAPAPLRATKSDENIMESLKALDTMMPNQDTKIPKSILKKSQTKPSKYEVEHREAIEDSRALLDQLPRGELQRNKIVLRVPSFRTAGCQTESYRPVRRRASCAQTNLSVAPRYRDNNTNKTSRLPQGETRNKSVRRDNNQSNDVLEMSSSSSGYSSPEVSSKDPSPAHSGPPSPASSSVVVSDEEERRTDSNVTVIEINRSETLPSRVPMWQAFDPIPPPRPPKPLRLRPMSDAATLMSSHGGLLVPVHRRASQLPLYEDVFGLAALSENVMLLTEAINPVLVHSTRQQEANQVPSTTPRVVDVIRKTIRPGTQDERTWDGRTSLLHHARPAVRTHSLSLPRPSLTTRLAANHISSSGGKMEQEQQTNNESESTAAYLASLELLASHYRHQALANAKQLQLQQRLLLQQQRQQQRQKHQHSDGQEQGVEGMGSLKRRSQPVSPVKEESEC